MFRCDRKNKQTTWWKCETGGASAFIINYLLEMRDKQGADEDEDIAFRLERKERGQNMQRGGGRVVMAI